MTDSKKLNALRLFHCTLKPPFDSDMFIVKACINMHILISIIFSPKVLLHLYQMTEEAEMMLRKWLLFICLLSFSVSVVTLVYFTCHLLDPYRWILQSLESKCSVKIFNVSILFYLTPIHLPQ